MTVYERACLSLEAAQRAVAATLAEAGMDGRAMAVAVVDAQGDLLCCARMDGAPARVQRFAIRKAYTAAVMGRDTLALKRDLEERQRSLADYGDPLFTTLQGGVAVRWAGQVVGGIGVGGSTQARDEEIARLALAAIGLEG